MLGTRDARATAGIALKHLRQFISTCADVLFRSWAETLGLS